MKKGILDASALIAFIQREPGSQVIGEWIANSKISAVNYAETLQKLANNRREIAMLDAAAQNCNLSIVDFDKTHAERAAEIYPRASKGISFADRACLSLGMAQNLPIITGDRNWQELDLDVEIILFRPSVN